MRLLDLFSGIGGFSLGLRDLGIYPVAFCEIEPFCQRVLHKHWPEVPIFGDIKKLNAKALERNGIKDIDIITGGFPCQDISAAGKGAGIAGSRSGLWRELVRCIRLVRPCYAIVENVAALLKRGMGRVLGDLASIGYDTEWDCISARAIGAIHQRKRVFLLAYRCGNGGNGRMPRQIYRQPEFSWLQDVRGIEDLRKRSAIHTPMLCGVDDGISDRVDRLKGIGNAIVPQLARVITRSCN